MIISINEIQYVKKSEKSSELPPDKHEKVLNSLISVIFFPVE